VHGGGGVDDEVEGEVFLLAEELEEEAVHAGEDVPVDVAEVIAGDVLAVVVELDGSAAFFRAAFAGELPGEDLPGEEVEAVELRQELGAEELVEGLGA